MRRMLSILCSFSMVYVGCEKAPTAVSGPTQTVPSGAGPEKKTVPAEALLKEAFEALHQGRDLEAVRSATAAIEIEPSGARAYALRAIARAFNAYYEFVDQGRVPD